MTPRTCIVWLLVFVAVFCGVSLAGHQVFWSSVYRNDAYGWPQAWLHLRTSILRDKTWIDSIEWLPCVISATISAGVTAVLLLPLVVHDWRKRQRKPA